MNKGIAVKENILEVNGLRKVFDGKTAVNGISFSFQQGDFIGLLGPNGAGKTTTIKMLTGLMRPSEGNISYYGKDFSLFPREVKQFIGLVPQQSNADRDLTAYENLYVHSLLHGIPKRMREKKIEDALDFAGLHEYRDRQVKTFSGGMKRRLVIVRALLHDPKILFLDEPTVGLDPQIRRNIWELVIKINQQKETAVLLTTHYIEEAEKLCRKVLIIHDGKIVTEGVPDDLKKGIGRYVLEMFREDRIEEKFFESREEALDVVRECTLACKVREVTLEDVFLKMTGRRIDV
jgi:ABC-2 type transport system ATP-binding protein